MKRVTDVITVEEVKTWTNKDVVTITAGTGVGKSYFIKNILYAFAKSNNKKILFLIHRDQCKEQFIKEIQADNKQDIIDIMTYQKLESDGFYFGCYDFSEYDYIVCDEFHYFISDASFNKLTDISLNLILKQNITRIFMSATGNHAKKYINNIKKVATKDYEVPINYDFINNLAFYYHNDTTEELIKGAIETNTKAIFFIQSAKEAFELYKKYKKHCLFNCSKSNKTYYKYVNQKKIDNMLVNQRFEELILITTSCMDAGVNIIDDELQTVVCDIKDIYTMLQCIGRKRLQHKNDKINVIIKALSNKQLGGIKSSNQKKIEKAEYFEKYGLEQYLKKHKREGDKDCVIYDDFKIGNECIKRVNELRKYKCQMDIADVTIMLAYDSKWGYCSYLSALFGKSYNIIEETKEQSELEIYLDNIVGQVFLTLEDRQPLIERLDVRGNGRLLKKIGNLNGSLEENEIPYRIVEFPTTRRSEGKKKIYKSAWKVVKLVDK